MKHKVGIEIYLEPGLIEEIDAAVEEGGYKSRTAWVTEAIEEKIRRD